MSVRRHAARLATVCALLGGLVAVGAAPALAAGDSVRVGSASSFTAGGSPQGVNVEVRKRSDGCVLLRTALGLRLSGLDADQVTVQVNYGGRWFPVPLGGGGGAVTTSQTSPAKPNLCKGKSITVRYRVAFAAGAPNGRLAVTGVATTALGHRIGQGSDTARVAGGRATASPTPSKKATPSPVATEVADVEPTLAAIAQPSGGAGGTAAEKSSGLSPVMFFGLALVAVGALLIVLLVRRFREDKASTGEPVGPLPGNPGGTTYRSAGGPPGAPVRPGQVYGQPPAGGSVYGATAPRPSGGVYGARPAPTPDPTRAFPGQPAGPTPPVPPAAPHSAPPAPHSAPRPALRTAGPALRTTGAEPAPAAPGRRAARARRRWRPHRVHAPAPRLSEARAGPSDTLRVRDDLRPRSEIGV